MILKNETNDKINQKVNNKTNTKINQKVKNKTLENYKGEIEPGCKLTFSVDFISRIPGRMTIYIKIITDKY